jgi:hypothetical protein
MVQKGKSLQATTTEQEDITTAGQRKVNLIWEYTQSSIAFIVTGALVYVTIMKIDAQELKNAFFLIIGFYFSRTNHQSIGGIGKKPNDPYKGR